jgi:hypothetical protein
VGDTVEKLLECARPPEITGEDFVFSSSLSGRAAFAAGKPDSVGHRALCVAPGFELVEELLYLLAEDLLVLEQGVALAIHNRSILAK